MEIREFKAYKRKVTRKNKNRRLREQKMAPGVLYGKDKDPVKVKFDPKELVKSLDPKRKRNTFFKLTVEDVESHTVIIKDVQFDDLSGDIIHIDFLRVNAEDKINVKIPIYSEGKSIGENMGGRLRTILKRIPIISKVSSIPVSITYDVSELEIGDIVRVEDMDLGEEVEFNINTRQAVFIVDVPKEEVEEETEEEELLLEGEEGEAAEGEEGEAAESEPAEK
ncbi:MAG: 50S ribosomal protein L25 [Deltaproteobacteria bacterium]|jgi:large subunit ribosomal protein L25|nr:50S ribosomal protein L25 [Deltaproteobacteria bacterium]